MRGGRFLVPPACSPPACLCACQCSCLPTSCTPASRLLFCLPPAAFPGRGRVHPKAPRCPTELSRARRWLRAETWGRGRAEMLMRHRAEWQSEFTGQGRDRVHRQRGQLCRSAQGPQRGPASAEGGEATPALTRRWFLSPCRLCLSVPYPKAWARWGMSPPGSARPRQLHSQLC